MVPRIGNEPWHNTVSNSAVDADMRTAPLPVSIDVVHGGKHKSGLKHARALGATTNKLPQLLAL